MVGGDLAEGVHTEGVVTAPFQTGTYQKWSPKGICVVSKAV